MDANHQLHPLGVGITIVVDHPHYVFSSTYASQTGRTWGNRVAAAPYRTSRPLRIQVSPLDIPEARCAVTHPSQPNRAWKGR